MCVCNDRSYTSTNYCCEKWSGENLINLNGDAAHDNTARQTCVVHGPCMPMQVVMWYWCYTIGLGKRLEAKWYILEGKEEHKKEWES